NIIVTGTSRGIGFELALQLAAQGHNVLALSRNIPQALLNHSNITCLAVDLTESSSFETVSEFLNTSWHKVHGIIHNAGALAAKPFVQTTMNDFQQIYKVNVFAVAELTRIALPFLTGGSHVVTISSMG